MPIKKVPVIHKFGIISESRQLELKEKFFSSQRKHFRSSPPNTERSVCHFDQVEELLYQITNAKDDFNTQTIEQDIMVWLLKLQHQLLSTHSKPSLITYDNGWKELSKIATCANNKVVYESLLVLKATLQKAPLSKHLIDCLLGICLSNIENFVGGDQRILFTDELKLRIEVCFLIVVRLYYHFLVKDINEKQFGQLEAIYLISRGIQKNTLSSYTEYPLCHVYLKVTMTMIEQTCAVMKTITEEVDEPSGPLDDQLKSECLQNSLKIWKSVSRNSRLDENILEDVLRIRSFASTDSKGKWLDVMLSMYILSESAKLDIRYSKLFLRLETKSKRRATTQNSRKVISSTPTEPNEYLPRNEQLSTVPSVFVNIEEFLNPTIIDKSTESNRQPKSSFLTGDNPPKEAAKNEELGVSNQNVVEDGNRSSWDWESQLVYLTCLAEITSHGLTIDIKKLALMGDVRSLGLLDYLSIADDGEQDWKVRCCCYQLLYDTYHLFLEDPMYNGLANVIWDALQKFEDNEKNVNVLKVLKILGPPKRLKTSTDDSLMGKVATNLSIVALEPCATKPSKQTCEVKKNERFNQKQNCTKQETDESKRRNLVYVNTNKPTISTYEKESWLEVQKIVAAQYKREVDEDEEEIAKIRQDIKPVEASQLL